MWKILAKTCALTPYALLLATGVGCSSGSVDGTKQEPTGSTGGQTPGKGPDWPMFGFVAARTNDGPADVGIPVDSVARLQRRQVPLPGTVDSSPIYLHQVTVGGAAHDVYIVTTAYGKTLAVDAASGSILWTFTPEGYDGWAGSYRITNAAPVADPDRQSVYAAAPDGVIRKLALADGHTLWATAITQLPTREKIAGALNFDAGHVLAATGGYIGDAPPYQGHVAVLDAGSGRIAGLWNSLCSDRAGVIAPASCPESGSAIWARRGVVVDPATHHLLFATGDGLYDGRIHWGDSVIELAGDASAMIGHWTPTNFQQLDAGDVDLGSTGPALLAGGYIAQSGKDGKLRLFQLPRTTAAGIDGETQTVSAPGGSAMHADPAVGSGSWLFATTRSGTAAWRLGGNQLQQAWSNGTGGTSPVLAGGLLWVFDPGGSLLVYRPETGDRLAALPAATGHWQSPIISDGRVALAQGNANDHATTGVLNIYSLR